MAAISISEPPPTPRTARSAAALALAVGFTLLYLSTPTRHYTFDAVAYAYQIDRFADDGRPGWLFHAHHLLFNAAGWSVWVVLQQLGLRVSSLEALQVMNAALGGLGVGLFALTLTGATGRPLLAVSLAALLGVSHGYWTCATDGRVNIPGLVGVLAAFGAALRWVESGSWRWALWSGALTGAAVLFHQSHVLFVPVLALAALLARAPWPRRLGSGLIAASGVGLVVAAGYATVAVAVKGVHDVAGLQSWLWQYGEDGRWWSLDWSSNLPLSAAALTRAVWPNPGQEAGQPLTVDWRGLDLTRLEGPLGWVFWTGTILLLARCPSVVRRHGAPLLLCGAWFVIYAAFFTIWNPGYFPFWLPQIAAAGMALGLITAGLLPDGERSRVPARSAGYPGSGWIARGWWPIRQRRVRHHALTPAGPVRGGRWGRRLLRPASVPLVSRPRAHLLGSLARIRCTRLRRAGRLQGRLRSRRPVRRPSPDASALIGSGPRALLGGSTLRPGAPRRVLGSMLDLGRSAAGLGAVGVVTAVMLVVFIRTYGAAIRPRMAPEANPYLQVAEMVRKATQPGDLILATGTGWLAQEEVYIPYFSKRPLLALQAVLKREHGDKEAALGYLRDYMARCWDRGGRVYILDEALASREAYEVLRERYGLGWEEARQFFRSYAPQPVRQAGAHSVWRLSPPAHADGMAAARQGPPRARVLGMRQRRVEDEAPPPPGAKSGEATTRKQEASDTPAERAPGAPGVKGDRPMSANEALTWRAAG